MSKYRCPVCGAAHKESPEKCRLCGLSMRVISSVPISTETKQVATKKKGIADVGLFAIGGVVLLALIFVILGFTGSNSFLENLRDKIPGSGGNDGWQEIDDGDGGFTARLPEDNERRTTPFPLAANGRLEQWVAPISAETELSISYAHLDPLPGGNDWSSLFGEEAALDLADTLGGRATQITESSFRGYPIVSTTITGLRMEDSGGTSQVASAKAYIVLRGDTAFIIQSKSVYADHPNFASFADSVQFTG
jgi:hypothetical protein